MKICFIRRNLNYRPSILCNMQIKRVSQYVCLMFNLINLFSVRGINTVTHIYFTSHETHLHTDDVRWKNNSKCKRERSTVAYVPDLVFLKLFHCVANLCLPFNIQYSHLWRYSLREQRQEQT